MINNEDFEKPNAVGSPNLGPSNMEIENPKIYDENEMRDGIDIVQQRENQESAEELLKIEEYFKQEELKREKLKKEQSRQLEELESRNQAISNKESETNNIMENEIKTKIAKGDELQEERCPNDDDIKESKLREEGKLQVSENQENQEDDGEDDEEVGNEELGDEDELDEEEDDEDLEEEDEEDEEDEEEKESSENYERKKHSQSRKFIKEEERALNRDADAENSSNGMENDFNQNLGKYSNTNTLVNFFNSYTMFVNEASNIILDLDLVLDKFVEAVKRLKPPTNSTPQTIDLWNSLLELDKKSTEDLSSHLGKLPEGKLFDTIQNIERLYIKLMIEYNIEVKRGKQLGIIKNENISN